ncbi:hypothetical protein D6D18_04047 [Aureobasidium pullulans]|nr:hypothetical protein D6D18_04047 [Aureobasidium pullulans]
MNMDMQHQAHREPPSFIFTRSTRIWELLAGDMAAAAVSATLVAPTVTIIDRAIVEKASSNQPLLRSLRHQAWSLVKSPRQFMLSLPFGIVWSLYAGTYGVANVAETISERLTPEHVGTIVGASAFLVNVPLGVWKDIRFAQMFARIPSRVANTAAATATATVPMPKLRPSRSATTVWLVRDALTLFGSFTFAPRLAAAIPDNLALHPQTISQLSVPALTQIVATPLHLLGLDLTTRQHHVPWMQRIADTTRSGLLSTTIVRCFRILPAFGFGCIGNTEMRKALHKQHEQFD